MRGNAASMRLLRPTSAEEALALYAAHPEAIPLAGGTDVMVAWNQGSLDGRTVLDLSAVGAWRGLRAARTGTASTITIGALADLHVLQQDVALRRDFQLLVQACSVVGAVQIQNRATLGGNIGNASPAGDTFPPLAVYEALVHVASADQTRTIPFAEVFRGVGETGLRPAELITAIELRTPPVPARQMFRKVGSRAAQTISKVVAAGLLWLDGEGRVVELRFALGSMAPTVRRLRAAEAAAKAEVLTAAVIDECCALLERDVAPIDDVRSTREYRLTVAGNLLRGFLSG